MDGHPCQVYTHREQDKGRYEGTDEGRGSPVPGEFYARDVHDPVEDEKEHGNYCGRAESPLTDQGAERGAYEEHDQACKGLGELAPYFDMGPPQDVGIFVGFEIVIVDCPFRGTGGRSG